MNISAVLTGLENAIAVIPGISSRAKFRYPFRVLIGTHPSAFQGFHPDLNSDTFSGY